MLVGPISKNSYENPEKGDHTGLGLGVTQLVWEPSELARTIQQSSYTKCLARNPEIQASGLLAAADATWGYRCYQAATGNPEFVG